MVAKGPLHKGQLQQQQVYFESDTKQHLKFSTAFTIFVLNAPIETKNCATFELGPVVNIQTHQGLALAVIQMSALDEFNFIIP